MLLIRSLVASLAFVFQAKGISGAQIRRNSQHTAIEDELHSKEHRTLQATGDFAPLSCNAGVTWSCQPWSSSFSLSEANVEIPCGACYHMDEYVSGEIITLTGTLNIKGRLEFNDGTKVTLRTTGVIVEGELVMTSTKAIDGNPDIIVYLDGTAPVAFTPHSDNSAACGGGACTLPAKPFVVAGGKLDISGISDTCPTWSTLESFIGAEMATPAVYPKRPTLATPAVGTCEYSFVSENFDSGTGTNGWYGNLGAEEYTSTGSHDGSNYLKITNRTATFQGPMFEISRFHRECLIPGVDYFFSAKIRLSAGPEATPGQVSACSTSDVNCPILRLSHMSDEDQVRWRTLAETKSFNYTDDEWITVKASFRFNELQVNASDVFTFLIINGPEAGIDIHLDDIEISLPPPGAYPDPTNVCGNLVVNGDASVLDGFAYPMRGYLYRNPVFVKKDDTGNQYFAITDRMYAHDNLVFDIVPGCLEEGSVYTFSMKFRIHSATPVRPDVILKFSPVNVGDRPSFLFIARDCPESSTDIGWVTCTNDVTFQAGQSTAPRVEALVLIQDDYTSDVDYDDISFVHKMGAPSALRVQDATQLDTCWSPGAQVGLPSETLNFIDAKVATIQAIVDGNGVDLVETISPSPSVSQFYPEFPAEMALLSRNILFKSGDASSVGPTLTVLNTPSVPQKIQGVELDGFGQEGVAGIHPINFKLSGNSEGSLVSKNSIRNSKNRCINIHGTTHVTISDNVSHETKGHCYALQDGAEVNNVFEHNIGFVNRNAVAVVPGETDNNAATFYITNPSNSWIDNAAAGANAFGFWFDLKVQVDGLSAPNSIGTNPFASPTIEFSGNSIHSNYLVGMKTFPFGMNPLVPMTWYDTKIYRNRGHGIFFHNTRDITMDGFLLADNKLGIDFFMSDKLTVQNTVIRGYTQQYENIVKTDPGGNMKHCWPKPYPSSYKPIIGIRIHSNAKVVGYGTNVISNVTFSDFNPETGCNPLSAAIMTNPNVRQTTFTGLVALSNLTFEAGTESVNMISLCDAAAGGVVDISIPDSSGSINPNGDGPGYIVSDTGNTACTPMTNTCARYCLDAGAATAAEDALAGGTGGTSGGTSGGSTGITSGTCLSNNWIAFRAAALQTKTGPDGETALLAGSRIHQQLGGLKQDFASSCLTLDSWYEVSADVRMTNAGTDDAFNCNPAAQWNNDAESCAGFALFAPPALGVTDIGLTVGPLNSTGWNKLYGAFKVTSAMQAGAALSIFVARAPISADITVANIVFDAITPSSPGYSDCSNPIINGDGEIGDHRFWLIRGGGTGKGLLNMTDGYNSTYGFRHTQKTARYRGMLQLVDTGCFEAGQTWVVTAKFRYYFSNMTATECNKADIHSYSIPPCPVFEMAADGTSQGTMTNEDASPMVVGEWNDIKHTVTISSDVAAAEKLWLFINQVDASAVYDLDDIKMVPA